MRYCEERGRLSVEGVNLVDERGARIRLKGVSTYWLKPYRQLLNKEAFRTLRDDWKANCLRLPVVPFVYTIKKEWIPEEEAILEQAVSDATELGMYVIIDWHVLGEQDPRVSMNEACAFFDKYAAKYASQGNVLYEICNEPNREGGSWENITEYANKVIPVIRSHDPHAVILCGTPCWSQWVDVAADRPLAQYDNILYSLHFYGATHKQELRDKAVYALEHGAGVFVNEFGLCSASGNGDLDPEEAEEWKKFLDEYGISYICWNLSTVDEAAAILKHECTKLSGWSEDDLSVQGRIVRGWMRGE